MKKYLYGFLVLIVSMIVTNLMGTIVRDAGNGEMTSGIFNTGIKGLIFSINLLSSIIVFCAFFIIEEIKKK
ncbi:hypothetical protein [Paenisporosarcina quisquiliarum]|uniref:hypothetical protein n=1 Tax=Paenisporosarcina quisquiliarum TaxID=365346 RepID=UPI003734ED3A